MTAKSVRADIQSVTPTVSEADLDTGLPSPATDNFIRTNDNQTLVQKGKEWLHGDHWRKFGKSLHHQFCTYDGLIGNEVDYKSMFIPAIPFTRWKSKAPHFYGVNDELPLVLTIILGFQHSLAMMGGLASPSLIMSSAAYLSQEDTEYLVSAAFVVAGFMTLLQILRFRIPYTNIYMGTGMISVLGQSFSCVSVFTSTLPGLYDNGWCPTAADGAKLPCRKAYGAFLGTGALCSLLQIVLSFVPPMALKKMFPPLVTGPVVLLVGASLVQSGMQDWGGGAGCYPDSMCNTSQPNRSYPWGSGQYVGLGFCVVVAVFFCDRFGAPIMKSCSIIIGLLTACIIAGACGYFQHVSIDHAPNGQFAWVRTFPLSLYGPIVLPILAVYITCAVESIGDITASADVSKLAPSGEEFESRIQGGVLAAGIGSLIGNLATITPLSSFAQNNGVISMTQVASRRAGFACCIWLIIYGCIGKWTATIAAMPDAVIGGMTTFLFASVAVSGIAVISKCKFTRRDRVVLALTLTFGLGSMLVPTWFQSVFTFKGDDKGKKGFLDAMAIVVQTPYCIAGVVGCLMNLILPEINDIMDVNVYAGEDPHDHRESMAGIEDLALTASKV